MSHISLRANLQPVPAIWQSICKLEYARQRQKIKKTSKWSKLSVLNKAKQQARHGQSTKKKKKNVDRKKWTQDHFFLKMTQNYSLRNSRDNESRPLWLFILKAEMYGRTSVRKLLICTTHYLEQRAQNPHWNLSLFDLQCLLSDMLFPNFNMIMPP